MKKSDIKASLKMYNQWLCVWSLIPEYEEGKIYPSIGWNNGTHIIGIDKYGNPFDGIGWNSCDERGNIVNVEFDDEDAPADEFGISAKFLEVKP